MWGHTGIGSWRQQLGLGILCWPSFGSWGLAVVLSVWECTLGVLGVLSPVLVGDPSGDIALSQDRPLSWLLRCIHAVPEGPS